MNKIDFQKEGLLERGRLIENGVLLHSTECSRFHLTRNGTKCFRPH